MNEPPIPLPTGDEPRVCPQCGANVRRTEALCPNCGARSREAPSREGAPSAPWSLGRVVVTVLLTGLLVASCGVGACSVWVGGTTALNPARNDAEGFGGFVLACAAGCLLVSAIIGVACFLALRRSIRSAREK